MDVQLSEVSCHCGHTYESEHKINWCPKCGEKIFETDRERSRHKMNNYYIYSVVGLTVLALAYFFFQLIIIPVLSM